MTALTLPAPALVVPTRRHDLDWVRIAAFLLLVPYHVGMYYVSWDWHIKSSVTITALEPLMILSAPWRLSLLFVISGVATRFMLDKRPQGFLRARSSRLLIPLVFGMLVVVTPQAYFEVLQKAPGGYGDGYMAFWGRYLAADDSFCRDGDCLDLPTWNHLWFVAYLWVYTVALGLGLRMTRGRRTGIDAEWLARPWRILWVPAAVLAVVRVALFGVFGSTHGLFDDLYNHAHFLPLFVLGYAVAKSRPIWAALGAARWRSLQSTVVLLAFLTTYFSYFSSSDSPVWLLHTQRVAFGMVEWTAIAAILGFASRWRVGDSAAKRYLTVAVFPLYILHQTLIIVFAWQLRPLGLRPAVEGPLLIFGTIAVSLAIYEAVRRVPGVRALLGIAAPKRTAPPAERQAVRCEPVNA